MPLAEFKAKSGRSPSATELLSLCVLKEKVTKEKEHPVWRLPGILPGKSVSRGRAFRQGILPWRKGADIPVGSSCAAYRPRLTAAQGPRVKQRAILARTLQKIWSKAEASADKKRYEFLLHSSPERNTPRELIFGIRSRPEAVIRSPSSSWF
jgi:hypothetical protein